MSNDLWFGILIMTGGLLALSLVIVAVLMG
jgi:hypothetical protein